MVDFLALDLNKFENQMLVFIEAYYNKLKEKKDKPLLISEKNLIKKDWKDQIINLFDNYMIKEEKEFIKIKSRINSTKNYLNNATRKGNIKLEFYMILDILEILYEIYFYKKNKGYKNRNIIFINMIRCISRELIELRNKLSHDENPGIEYILRFYEDQYYLIKYLKIDDIKIELSDYITKDIKHNIHIYLSKILDEYDKTFEFDSLKIESNKNKELNKIQDINEDIDIEEKNEIESMFQSTPFKLPKYNFFNKDFENEKENDDNINIKEKKEENEKKEEEDKIEKEDEKDIYEQSLDNSSQNSYSKISSISSERSSINETGGNIKEDIEVSVDKSQVDILKKI